MLSDLRHIPRIQRSRGWTVGAKLLDTWFSRPASPYPSYTAPDTTTISMDGFALGFKRANAVYDQILNDKMWTTPNAQKEITKMLRRKGLLCATPISFGSLSDPVNVQDPDYVTELAHKNPLIPPEDDLTAALANFNFRVLVAGLVVPVAASKTPRQYTVTVTEIGVYVWDSFDFEGFQPLGCWSDSPDEFSLQPTPVVIPVPIGPFTVPVPTKVLTPVFNSTFRSWRAANHMGGDFLVFSDVKRTLLTPPFSYVAT